MASPAIRSSAGALRHQLRRLLSPSATRCRSYSTKGCRLDKETLASAKIKLEDGARSKGQHTKAEEEQSAKKDSPAAGWVSLSKKCWTSIHIGGRDVEVLGVVSLLWDIADKIMDSK